MWRGFSQNLRTFLLALVLALAVWISAVTSADPDQVRIYPEPVTLEIVGQDPALILIGTIPRSLEVTLRAPRSIWDKMLAYPNSVRAFLDLSGLQAGQYTVAVQVQVSEWPVRVLMVTPAAVSIQLERLVTLTLPIEPILVGELPIGYQQDEVFLEPKEVIVSGPESRVKQVASAVVEISLDGKREDINESHPVRILDGQKAPVGGLTLTPANVQVNLPIVQQGGYRDVVVKVVVRGQPADGYRLASITSFPPVVTVFSSDPTLVNSLPGYVETQPLDLNDAKSDISTRLGLSLPEQITVVGAQDVLVQVGVTAIQSSLTLSGKQVELAGLGDGLVAHIAPQTVDVILSGPLPILNMLSPQDVRVIVDVTDLGTGTYQLIPDIQVLVADLQVESILPAAVEVVISPVVTPTPKP